MNEKTDQVSAKPIDNGSYAARSKCRNYPGNMKDISSSLSPITSSSALQRMPGSPDIGKESSSHTSQTNDHGIAHSLPLEGASSDRSSRSLPGLKASRRSAIVERRNPDIEIAMERLNIYEYDGIILREKLTVELTDGEFLRIICILRSIKTGTIFVRGHTFRRTRYMNGMFNNKRNEVCWIQEIDDNDPRPPEMQSMETVPVSHVSKRRGLGFTNQAYPALSYLNDHSWTIPQNKDPNKKVVYEFIEKNAPLTCRTKFVRYFIDAEARRKNTCYERAVRFLQEGECGDASGNTISDLQLRQIWRGDTEKGGAQIGMEYGEREFLRQEALSNAGKFCSSSLLRGDHKYEYADVMTRRTVGDLLIRDEKTGVVYQKLSGVGDACFTRSTLNIVTGKEIFETKASDEAFVKKIREGLHGDRLEDGIFRMDANSRRTETEDSNPRCTSEVIEIDAQWRRFTNDSIYQHRIEGRLKNSITPRLPATPKRTASDAFPSANLGKSDDPCTRKNEFYSHGVDLDEPTTLPSSDESLSGDMTLLNSLDLTSSIPDLSEPISTFTGTNEIGARKPVLAGVCGDAGVRNPTYDNATVRSVQTRPKSKPALRRYTFGDCFCGAGGMSRAAVMAGLRIKWGFDFNDIACYTYALNFIGARVYHEEANLFATSRADQKCDICHISPPCKYFSPAHTRPGRGDEESTASFFAVGELLKKTRCRIVILEQTAGLINRHEQYFHSCVREFTERGFSVRWRVINCADYGLPQRRMRLFMIASWYVHQTPLPALPHQNPTNPPSQPR